MDIIIAASGMPFGPSTIDHLSLGGSETAVLMVAKEIKKLGHTVTVFCNLPPQGRPDFIESGSKDDLGIRWVSLEHYALYVSTTESDLLIVSRDPGLLQPRDGEREDVAPTGDGDEATGEDDRQRSATLVIHFVYRMYGEGSTRFGALAPDGSTWSAECGPELCVADARWWSGPGHYELWYAEPGHPDRRASVDLAGHEFEVRLRYGELEVVHPIDGVVLEVAPGSHDASILNRTDQRFTVWINDDAALFDLVRSGPDGWVGPRERPQLECGDGLGHVAVEPRSTVHLGSLEQNLFWFRDGPQDAGVFGLALFWIYGVDSHHENRDSIWWPDRPESDPARRYRYHPAAGPARPLRHLHGVGEGPQRLS